MVVSHRLDWSEPAVKEIRAVRNACAVLEAVVAHQPVGVSELARVTGIDKSAVQRILVTLRSAGWLTPAVGGTIRWELPPTNPLLLHTVSSVLEGWARPAMERLRDQSEETVLLVTRAQGQLVIAGAAESRHPIRLSPTLGYALPFEGSATGTVIAAQLPDGELAPLQKTHSGLTHRRLAAVRRQGWAANDRQVSEGIRAVAAAILADGYPVGALVIYGPTRRVSADDVAKLGRMVSDAASQVLTRTPPSRR